ncbi:MAG: glycosyltransferase family 9 protein [Campylobacterota bacterium]|nr:glycosyltransferase family 9 protein [Campylobacterota bacterium]
MLNINRIGIIMYGLLGDVLMRTPIIRTLKKYYKNSEIYAIVDPIGKSVLENNPDIEHIIVANRKKDNKLKYIANKIKIQYQLYTLNLDMIIDLYGGSSTKNMLKLAPSKYKVGYYDSKIWSKNIKFNKDFNISQFKNQYHLTNKLFPLISFINFKANELNTRPFIYSDNNTDLNIKKYIETFVEKKNNYYLISLGSGDLGKILELEKTYEIIKFIQEEYNLTPAIILNPGQEFLQEKLIKEYLIPNGIEFIELKPLSIKEIVSLMKYSEFIIVPDTGLYHIAVAVGIPIFSIFTYTNPKLVEPSSGKFKLCYKEIDEYDIFGLNKCTKELDIKYLKQCFSNFYLN